MGLRCFGVGNYERELLRVGETDTTPFIGPVNLEEQVQMYWDFYDAVKSSDKAMAYERLLRHFNGIRLN